MDEAKAIDMLGVVGSSELQQLLDKSIRQIIRQLHSLEDRGMIKVLIFKSKKHRRRLYMKNEIYDCICSIKKS